MKRLLSILAIILVLCLMWQSSWATNAYITDFLKVTLRTGPSTENKIIAVLYSGQIVEVLNSEGDWSYVRLLEGGMSEKKEGWMLSQYLITRQPWELIAKSLKKENTLLKENEKKLTQALNQQKDLKIKLQENTEAFNKLKKEYESLSKGSTGYLKLKEKYDKAQSILETAQKDVQRLTEENKKLESLQSHKWFLTGALVLLSGLIIGLLIGRKQKKRKTPFYSIPG
jgi:SH3 domain protein